MAEQVVDLMTPKLQKAFCAQREAHGDEWVFANFKAGYESSAAPGLPDEQVVY